MNKAKLFKFTYTKSNGEVSDRKVITLGYSTPELQLVIDVTNDDKNVIDALIPQLEQARRKYLDYVEGLANEYDVQIKTFKLSGMSNKMEVV